jgi:hypothetical protein
MRRGESYHELDICFFVLVNSVNLDSFVISRHTRECGYRGSQYLLDIDWIPIFDRNDDPGSFRNVSILFSCHRVMDA